MIRRRYDLPVRSPVLVAIVLVAAVAAHGGAWYFLSQHWVLSGGFASLLIAIPLLKHLGWIGAAYALLRRRGAPREEPPGYHPRSPGD